MNLIRVMPAEGAMGLDPKRLAGHRLTVFTQRSHGFADDAIRLDLVSEGVDWFERCGSPTTTHPLWVV